MKNKEQNGSLAQLFEAAGYPYEQMGQNEFINIENQNFKILSFDLNQNKTVFKRVLSLVRKDDSQYWGLMDGKTLLLKGTETHKVYDIEEGQFLPLKEVRSIEVNGELRKVTAVLLNEVGPVLDIEVEDTHCYFSNGILSHNTTGGNALKFYASQRIDIRRTGVVKDGEEVIANSTRIKVIKNKLAPPFRETNVEIRYGKGIDKDKDIIGQALEKGILVRSGAWYSFKGENIGQGLPKTVAFLDENPEIKAEIISLLYPPKERKEEIEKVDQE